VFTFEGGKMQGPTIRRTGEKRDGSEKTTRENRVRDDRAVS
jgi:hypothetical protein